MNVDYTLLFWKYLVCLMPPGMRPNLFKLAFLEHFVYLDSQMKYYIYPLYIVMVWILRAEWAKSCGTKKRCQYSHEAKPSVNTDTEFFHARFYEFSTQNECHHVSGYICNTSVWIWKHPVCEQCPFSPMVCFFFPFLLPSFCENFTNLKFSLYTHTCVSTGVGLTSDLKAHTCSVFTLGVFIFTLVVLQLLFYRRCVTGSVWQIGYF